ncbi:MAG: type II toxin-antitoxin system HicA family toxin [Candidatus Micrarchaeota archaeon]|nr:type II toxin-antitoxin system HicA family toxin [Candidatus Micrarchaeota archaeon]
MKLPVVSGRELVKALSKIGYEADHQTGSHIILRRVNFPHVRVTVPAHPAIAKGTLLAIMKHVGITREALLDLLHKRH